MRLKTTAIALICFFLLAFITTPALASKDYSAETFTVQVDIQPGGSLLVIETVTFRFDGGPFTYVFREISRAGMDDIQVLDVSMDGVILQQGEAAGQVEIIDGDPVSVKWHFEAVSDSVQEFVLRYRVEGAIRSGETDMLLWQAIPEEHDYKIDSASIVLTYPSGLHPLETPSLDEPFEIKFLDNGVRLDTGQLMEAQGLELTAIFTAGSLVSAPPDWQVRADAGGALARQALPLGAGAAGLSGMVGVLLVVLATRRFRREHYESLPMTQTVSTRPDNLAPALAARLAGSGTHFLGTIFDLARKGLLEFQEGPKQWGSRTFKIIRHTHTEILAPHESVLLDSLFRKGDNVPLDDISRLAYSSAITQALDNELTGFGLRDPLRAMQKSHFVLWNGIVSFLGIVLFGGGMLMSVLPWFETNWVILLGAGLIGTGVAAMAVGVIGLIVSAFISPLSDEGEHQADLWKRYCGYLHSITQGKASDIQPVIFERDLPYAAAFGIASDWGKYFKNMPDVPVPEWLGGMQNSLEDGSFVTILAVLTAADSSASVAVSGDGGGASASGGGSSGAG